jgi:hypothetical protein
MYRTMFIEIAIAVMAAAALFKLLVNPQPAVVTSLEDDTDDWDGPVLPYFDPPLARVSYGTKPGARVFGWPAKGGVYILLASAVELEFLGYGRFKPVPRPDPTDPGTAADEEAHCNKSKPPPVKLDGPGANVVLVLQCGSWVPCGGRASTRGLTRKGKYARDL